MVCNFLIIFIQLIVFGVVGGTTFNDNQNKSPIIHSRSGDLEGIKFFSRRGREYYGFLGIPFGDIPQRFSNAEPVKPWPGIKVVDSLPPPCIQLNDKQILYGVENCLMLNLYTPKIDAKLPVLVWLFPGGFQVSGASSYEAKYFMDEDVVLVSINYRLGAMGFLDTADGTILGNMGLKDQVLAMKWIKENIQHFGGDPSSITLIGMSAGASSVNYHVLSSMSTGLFHKAVAQSGSALNPWALQYKPRELFEKFSVLCGCSGISSSEDVISCLRSKPADQILTAQHECFNSSTEFNSLAMQFVPTMEYSEGNRTSELSKSQPRFIQEHPYSSMKTGRIPNKVPYLASFTNNEGAFDSALMFTSRETIEELNRQWDHIAPNMLYLNDVIEDPLDFHRVTQSIRKHYFGNENITWENKQIIADIISARSNTNGIVDTALLLSPHQPVYAFVMNYEGRYSGIQFLFQGVKDKNKVAHADELLYMFNRTNGYPECELDSEDGKFSEKFIRFLVSFARDGKPAWNFKEPWKPLSLDSKDNLKFYELNLENCPQVADWTKSERDFWGSLKLNENEHYKSRQRAKDEL